MEKVSRDPSHFIWRLPSRYRWLRLQSANKLATARQHRWFHVNQNLDQVVTVETKHHQVVGSPIPIGEFADPYDVVVAPNGNTLYVVNRNANDVAVVDISPQ